MNTVVRVFFDAVTASATRLPSASVSSESISTASLSPVTSVELTKKPSGEPVMTCNWSLGAGDGAGATATGGGGGAGAAAGGGATGAEGGGLSPPQPIRVESARAGRAAYFKGIFTVLRGRFRVGVG